MFHSLKLFASALIPLALSVVGFSDAQATIIIDTFVDTQFAPPDSEIDAPAAIGEKRTLSADGQVIGAIGSGAWVSYNSIFPGGSVEVTYDAGGDGLGLDLTESGVNTRFEFDLVVNTGDDSGVTGDLLNLFINDADGNQSSFTRNWADLPGIIYIGDTGRGTFLLPFALLTGGADLTSIDSIRIRHDMADPRFTAMGITEIRTVVPEPGTTLLLGLGLSGLGVVGRSQRRATHDTV